MKINNVDFYVSVKNRAIDEYRKDGKIFVEGRKGSNYKLVVKNNSSVRKKVVLSVDGLNIMTGNTEWTRGYVLDPWATIEIPGWRINSDKVAAFEFSSVGGSYNQHNDSGEKKNVGVIGCMVFDEQPAAKYVVDFTYRPHTYYCDHWTQPNWLSGIGTNSAAAPDQYTTTSSVNSGLSGSLGASGSISSRPRSMKAFSAAAEPQPQNIGTGWGQDTEFKTVTVDYKFNDKASNTLLIYYDSAAGLKRRGINLKKKVQHHPEPEAFPGVNDGCPRPR